jgi:calcineurin-like phosphoesterase family protein
MTEFVISDQHFGHNNVIKYCNRPFYGVEHMEDMMIERWNEVVTWSDTVYILGDFAFCSASRAQEILSRLTGSKVFVWGNHDRGRETAYCKVPGVTGTDFIRKKYNGKSIVMTHYPFESFREDYHFHGHTHGQSVHKHNRFDVGVDSVAKHGGVYAPIVLDKAIELCNDLNYLHNTTLERY